MRSTGTSLFPCFISQTAASLATRIVEIRRRGWSAGFALIPELTQAAKIFLAQFPFELPVADGLANYFTGGGVFPGFNGGLERTDLLGGQGDAEFLHIRHD